jgi:hypothetical protein
MLLLPCEYTCRKGPGPSVGCRRRRRRRLSFVMFSLTSNQMSKGRKVRGDGARIFEPSHALAGGGVGIKSKLRRVGFQVSIIGRALEYRNPSGVSFFWSRSDPTQMSKGRDRQCCDLPLAGEKSGTEDRITGARLCSTAGSTFHLNVVYPGLTRLKRFVSQRTSKLYN